MAFDRFRYAELMQARQHDEAIALVDKARLAAPDDPELQRFAALARGGKGEHTMQSYDQMRVAPSAAQVQAMVDLFNDAIAVDPTLADPYWDLAVVYGRFLKDADKAEHYLAQARALDYSHPMMPALVQLIEELRA